MMGSVVNRCQNILAFQTRIVFEDFLKACARTQKLHNISYADAHPAAAGASAALAWVESNATESIRTHKQDAPKDSLPRISGILNR